MIFFSGVQTALGGGLPGESSRVGVPRVALAAVLGAASYIGRACTLDATTDDPVTATPGGAIGANRSWGGIITGLRSYINRGTTSSTLDPSTALAANTPVELVREDFLFLAVAGATKIGHLLTYDTTTGELSSVAPGASVPAGFALVPGGRVEGVQSASGVAECSLCKVV